MTTPKEETMSATIPTAQPVAKPGEVVGVAALPSCDFCPAEAHYDFQTFQRPWAYGCERCYLDNRAYTSLGVGKGQRLIVAPAPPVPGTVGAILASKDAR
jgi:hypothetical protein